MGVLTEYRPECLLNLFFHEYLPHFFIGPEFFKDRHVRDSEPQDEAGSLLEDMSLLKTDGEFIPGSEYPHVGIRGEGVTIGEGPLPLNL